MGGEGCKHFVHSKVVKTKAKIRKRGREKKGGRKIDSVSDEVVKQSSSHIAVYV